MTHELFRARVQYERFILELQGRERPPAYFEVPPPPLPADPAFGSWLRAARFWRDLRRRYGNGSRA